MIKRSDKTFYAHKSKYRQMLDSKLKKKLEYFGLFKTLTSFADN